MSQTDAAIAADLTLAGLLDEQREFFLGIDYRDPDTVDGSTPGRVAGWPIDGTWPPAAQTRYEATSARFHQTLRPRIHHDVA